MTTIEGTIAAYLLADSTTTGIIGTRIHPATEPKPVSYGFPKLTWQRIDSVRTYTNDGPLGAVTARIQFDAWANDLLTAKQLASAVRQTLSTDSGGP